MFYLGDNVRKIRQQQGLTNEEFAEEINISSAQLSKIENNRQHLTLELVLQICLKVNDFSLYLAWKGELESYVLNVTTKVS